MAVWTLIPARAAANELDATTARVLAAEAALAAEALAVALHHFCRALWRRVAQFWWRAARSSARRS